MKRFSRWMLVACVTAGCESGGDSAGSDGTTSSDGTDGVEQGGDATDSTTDSTDGSDATDSEDGTVAGDADSSDATDSEPGGSDGTTDSTDGTTDSTDGTTDSTDGTTDSTDGTTDSTDSTDGTTDSTDSTDGTTDSTDGTTDGTTDGELGNCPAIGGTLALNETSSGDTTGKTSNYEDCGGTAGGDDSFDGFDSSDGLPSGDEAWVFTAPEAGVYPVEVVKDFFGTAYAQTDCKASATCLGSEYSSSDVTVEVKLDAGESALIVVDGDWSTDEGTYTITVGSPCIPQCDGKQCGDDGCGQDCGPCTTGFCQDSQCIDLPATCDVVQNVACGETLEDLSNAMPGAVAAFSEYTCQSFSSDDFSKSPESIFLFTSAFDQEVTITGKEDSTLELIVLEDIGGGCEDTAESCVLSTSSSGSFDAKAGVNYYIIWDNYSTTKPVVTGFEMRVDCCVKSCENKVCGDDGCGGTCGTCDSGFCADGQCTELPTTCEPVAQVACGDSLANQSNSVAGVTAAFSKYTCQSYSGDDFSESAELTYSFTSDVDQIVTLSTENAFPLQLAVLRDVGAGCVDSGASCLDATYGDLTFNAKAGETYYFIWDSYSIPVVGGFSVDVECCVVTCDNVNCGDDDGCGGTCGCSEGDKCGADSTCQPKGFGEWCGDPAPLDSGDLPVTVEGSLLNSSDSFVIDDACGFSSNYGDGGYDNVYQFQAPEDGYYNVTLNPGTEDAVLYVTTSCEAPSSACLAGDYTFGEAVEVGVALSAGETVFIIVDSYYTGEPLTAYTLSVSAPEALGPGDGCVDPIGVDSLPFSFAGNTADGIDAAYYYYGECSGASSAGSSTKDQTLRFQAPAAGKYPLTVTPQFSAIVIVTTTCTDVNKGCIAGDSVSSGEKLELILTLEANQEVFINIDGYYSGEVGAYQLDIGDVLEAAAGDSCSSAINLGSSVPASASGDNSSPNVFSDYERCDGPGASSINSGGDIVYAFTAPIDGDYAFMLKGYVKTSEAPSLISVRTSCDNLEDSCLAGVDLYIAATPLKVALVGGETYYVVVASFFSSEEGTYTLTIDAAN